MKQKAKATVDAVAHKLWEQVTPAAIKEGLAQLPEDIGQVLDLYFFEQLTTQEISEKIQRSRTTTSKKLMQGCYYLEKYFNTPSYQQARQILYEKGPNRISF